MKKKPIFRIKLPKGKKLYVWGPITTYAHGDVAFIRMVKKYA